MLRSSTSMIKIHSIKWHKWRITQGFSIFSIEKVSILCHFMPLPPPPRFDAPFFNFSAEQANQCAPDVRVMLEVAWETIVDAGCDPRSLENTPTGVYIGMYWGLYRYVLRGLYRYVLGFISVCTGVYIGMYWGLFRYVLAFISVCTGVYIGMYWGLYGYVLAFISVCTAGFVSVYSQTLLDWQENPFLV